MALSTIPISPAPTSSCFPTCSCRSTFEPRYKARVADALDEDRMIGMVCCVRGWESDYEDVRRVFHRLCG